MKNQREQKRNGWRALSVVLIAMLLSACGIKLPSITEDQQIIVLWHNFTGVEADAFQTLVDGYNAANTPEVILIAEYQDDILGKLQSTPDSAHPDIVTLQPRDLPVYEALGLINAVPANSEAILAEQQDMLPMGIALYSQGGRQVAVPLGLATYLLYYNADWTGDLGYAADIATYEDFRRTACAASDPLTGQSGLGIPAQPSMMFAFLAAGGSQIVDDNGQYQFSDEAGIAYAQALHDILRGDCGSVYGDWSVGLSKFSKSSMAMAVDSSKMLGEIENTVAAGRNFQLHISAIPGATGSGVTLWYGPGMMVISHEPEQAETSLDVLRYFIAEESQMVWADKTNYLPVRRSLLEASLEGDLEFLTLEQSLAQITLQAADRQLWAVWSPYNDHNSCRGALLRTLLKLKEENAVPEQYIGIAVTNCNNALHAPILPESTPSPEFTPTPEGSN